MREPNLFHGLFYADKHINIKRVYGGETIKKKSLVRRITDSIGKEVGIETFDSFLLQIDAMGELSVKGCQKLLVCEEDRIEMDCGSRMIGLAGKGLRVDTFSESLTRISGMINGIRIEQWEVGK